MSLSLLGFQSYMLTATAALSQIAFSYTAACRGDGYQGKSKPAISLTETLMPRRECLQRADRLPALQRGSPHSCG